MWRKRRVWINSRVKRIYGEEEEEEKGEKGKGRGRKERAKIRRRTNLIPASPSRVPFMIAWIMFGRVIGMIVFMNRRI